MITKSLARRLPLTADLAAHLSTPTGRISIKKLVSWNLGTDLDPRRAFTAVQRRRVYKRDGGTCFYCGVHCAADDWQCDHVLPWSRGGRTLVSNAVVACSRCNGCKSDKLDFPRTAHTPAPAKPSLVITGF